MKRNYKIVFLVITSFIFIAFLYSCISIKDNSIFVFDNSYKEKFKENNKENFGFAISSDPHFFSKNSNYSAAIKILQILEKYYNDGKIEGFFILGDFFDNGGKIENWFRYLQTIQSIAPNLPILSVIGNHDKYFGGEKYWKKIFNNQNTKNVVWGPTAFTWYYKFKTFHFIGLNLPWGKSNMSINEKNWVKNLVINIPKNDFLIILSHSFFYSSGYRDLFYNWFDNKGNINTIAPLFIKKAKLVVSGHNHYMEWIENDNIYWAIIGAMGGKPDPEPSYFTNGSKWFSRGTNGFLLIEKTRTEIICSFIDQYENVLFSKILSY